MSRIGKQPVKVPSGVNVEITESTVKVSGPKGDLKQSMPAQISVAKESEEIVVKNLDKTKTSRANQGLMRSLLNNMIEGVTQGFKKQLEVEGVGFKVNVSGNNLKLALGYSHDVNYSAPQEISLSADGNIITVEGASKQLVGQVASEIRSLRKPEPYKGKGIHYVGEQILRKAGKAAGAGE